MGCPELPLSYYLSLNRHAHFEKSLFGFFNRCQEDPIGNRLTSSSTETGSTVTRTYTANQLNQYTAINNPTAAPTYDDDGNTVSCPLPSGDWTMTWDAENRLITAEKTGQRLEFKYDYLSRRVEKRVLDGESETSKERFVYNGFKQVEKLDALDSNAILQKFVWAGETILSMTDGNDTYYYTHDANKNVSELIADDGTIKAHYEYSPFGKTTVANGDLAYDNPFRFSSEFVDDETGLVYYNYRYYDSETGRWLSKDPIQELGGANLYAMVNNKTINTIDILGLACDCGDGSGGSSNPDPLGIIAELASLIDVIPIPGPAGALADIASATLTEGVLITDMNLSDAQFYGASSVNILNLGVGAVGSFMGLANIGVSAVEVGLYSVQTGIVTGGESFNPFPITTKVVEKLLKK